jgi:hypothetical protein
MPTTARHLTSIQGDGHKRGRKSAATRLNDRTLATATRKGMRFERNDYQIVLAMRENDIGIAETAIILERTYFGTQALYASVGLLQRCFPEVLELMLADAKQLKRKVAQARRLEKTRAQ